MGVCLIAVISLLLASCGGRPTPTPEPLPTQTARPTPTATPLYTPTPPFPAAITVNGAVIFQPEYEAALQQAASALTLLDAQDHQSAAAYYLVRESLLAEASPVSEAEVFSELERLATAVGGKEALDRRAADLGYPAGSLPYALARSLGAARARQELYASLPEKAPHLRARLVLFDDQAAAGAFYQQASQPGADLTALAYALDPYTGFDLGWFLPGSLPDPAANDALEALEVGRHSAPFEFSGPQRGGWGVAYLTGSEDRPLSASGRAWLFRQKQQALLAQKLGAAEVSVPGDGTLREVTFSPAQASEAQPFYRVPPGSTLIAIAQRLRLPLQALLDANPAVDPQFLSAGAKLILPGVRGWEGEVVEVELPPGTSAETLALAYRVDPALAARLNRLASPAQSYSPSAFLLPASAVEQERLALTTPLAPGEALLSRALQTGESPFAMAFANGLTDPLALAPGVNIVSFAASALPPPAFSVKVDTLPLIQGRAYTVRVTGGGATAPSGSLDGADLNFFAGEQGWTAYQGIHALSGPGLAQMTLILNLPEGLASYDLSLPLYAGDFPLDPPLQVDPETIDPTVTTPEDAQIAAVVAPATPEKFWSGAFLPPTDSPGCTRSRFGDRRSFNDSGYIYFHAGLDYGVCAGTDIYAPAPGVVVFAGQLAVRGYAVIIDHGWGVYSGFWHQQDLRVKAGDRVNAGDVIGAIGATGRVTGEHLHWEVWAGGVQVDPLQWLEGGN